MGFELTISGMHCESCGKLIERTVSKHEGAKARLDVPNNRIFIDCTEEQLSSIRRELSEKGYQLLLPGEAAKEGSQAGSLDRGLAFLSGVLRGAPEFAVENRLVRYAGGSLALILVVQLLLFSLVFRNIPNFFGAYSSVTLLTAVSVVALVFSYYHAEAFRKKATCMTGMMIGMSFGMAGGFLIGAFAGATNGMFVGSLVGMAVGMGLGYQTGRCCGVMGVMEGLMGGLMAGTMGAMLSVMLVFDHLVPFLFILTATELAIMAAFSYMLYKEYGSAREAGVSGLEFAVLSLAFDLALTAVFVYGPKAGVVLGSS